MGVLERRAGALKAPRLLRQWADRAATRLTPFIDRAYIVVERPPGPDMAGISVTLEGKNIQLAFEKNDNTTAVVMDPGTAQSLILALGQMLLSIESETDADAYDEEDFFDLDSPTVDIGTDERGSAVMALQAGPLPPMVMRMEDEEARHIAQALLDILATPRDVRSSQGDH